MTYDTFEEGTKRSSKKQIDIRDSLTRRIVAGATGDLSKLTEKDIEAGGAISKIRGEKLSATDVDSAAKTAQLVADYINSAIIEKTGTDAYAFDDKLKGARRKADEIRVKEDELKAAPTTPSPFEGADAGIPKAPVETIAASSLNQEDYLKGLYEEGVQKQSSIAVHDAHCEKILTTIASALTGGEGTAANPTSETGGVTFTQSLDSRGFQDGVDKFSQTVDGLREVMAGALTIEVGGTVTLDINLKEGAGFLQDSQNALGILVSGKINDAINNFIRNGLKDARINTGSWAADDSGTALSSNSNTSGGMGLS